MPWLLGTPSPSARFCSLQWSPTLLMCWGLKGDKDPLISLEPSVVSHLPALQLYLLQVSNSPVLLRDPNNPLWFFSDFFFLSSLPLPQDKSEWHSWWYAQNWTIPSILQWIGLSLLDSPFSVQTLLETFYFLYTQVLWGWLYVPRTVLVNTTLTAGDPGVSTHTNLHGSRAVSLCFYFDFCCAR